MTGSDGYPKPWPLFWAAAVYAAAHLAVALALKRRGWRRGLETPAAPAPDRGRATAIWLAETLAQRQLLQLSRLRWAAHAAVFWGFLGLCLLSALHVALQGLAGAGLGGAAAAWLLRGEGRALLKGWGNLSGLVLLAGLLLSLGRRLARPRQPAPEAPESDLPLVLLLLGLTLSGFALEGLRLAAASASGPAAALRPWLTALWTLHGVGGLALVAWLPHGGLRHALLAPLVVAENARAEHARKDLYWPKKPRLEATGSPQA